MDRSRSTSSWLREPLLHFLLLGALLFLAGRFLANPADDPQSMLITVDADTLRRTALAQRPDLTATTVDAYLQLLPADELRALVAQHVREEALVREARRLGLAEDDAVVRQRLVSKLQRLQERTYVADPSEDELETWFEEHMDDYRQPALLTFAHVFFDNRKGGEKAARARALDLQQKLNEAGVSFAEGPQRGDPYHYQPAYVQRPQALLTQHFSRNMAQELFALPVQDGLWQGPVASPYGQHLVMIRQSQPGGLPPFATAREQVLQDFQRGATREASARALEDIVERYTVRLDLGDLATEP